MRLWTLHPKYLDPPGLVALWREALLAKAVLYERTQGYKYHPQLDRFTRESINVYLQGVWDESQRRGYKFDATKIDPTTDNVPLRVPEGQVLYEWQHLMDKLKTRCTELWKALVSTKTPKVHPMFHVAPGGIAEWERT